MRISQLQFSFIAEQDRLLLRIAGDSAVELRVWLTRRLVKGLWHGLLTITEKKISLQKPAATPEAQTMLGTMDREQHLQSADFTTPFRSNATELPLGSEPQLVVQVDLHLQPNGQIRMSFFLLGGAKIDLELTDPLYHGFSALLQECARKADWDIELNFPDSADTMRLSADRQLN